MKNPETKAYCVLLKTGALERVEASKMLKVSDSLQFFKGEKLILIFSFDDVRIAGEAEFFAEQNIDRDSLSEERLNAWLDKLPRAAHS